MSEILHAEEFGQTGKPVFICLHGLLGSSRNWRSVARDLSDSLAICTLDLPNHGKSPHTNEISVSAMAEQVLAWLDHSKIEAFSLCGHSLGGKVAMRIACDHPERVENLTVVDIAPRDYPPEHHIPTLDALLSLGLDKFTSRKEIDEALTSEIPNWAFRQFLLTNLEEISDGFRWKPNLVLLRKSIGQLSSNPLEVNDRFDGPTLFVRGGKSGYLRTEHYPQIRTHFPQSQIEVLQEVGHDVHVEDRPGFLRIIREFLSLI